MEFEYKPHAAQAFNWERDFQHMVGHVTKFVIGSTTFTADLTVVNPLVTSGTNTMTIVGAIERVHWSGKPGGELILEFMVSTATRRGMLMLIHQGSDSDGNVSDLSAATVTLGFVVYDFDPDAKTYYKAFHTGGTPITGTVKTGTEDNALDDLEDEEEADRQAQAKETTADQERKSRGETIPPAESRPAARAGKSARRIAARSAAS